MKYVIALFLALSLTACNKETPAERDTRVKEERTERTAKFYKDLNQREQMIDACLENKGVSYIEDADCYRGRCRELVVKCNNGMERRFKNLGY